MLNKKNISLAIVTFNNETIIGECIESLLACGVALFFYNLKIVIVDNGSVDSTNTILQAYAQKDSINLIQNKQNFGFGAAHNIAIEKSSADYHIICNPDIVVNSETISKLTAYMDEHAEIGLLCPKLLNSDGSLQPNNHKHPTILDLALRRLAPAWLKARFKKRMDTYLMLDVGYETVCDVPFLSGAFMFCRTEVLKQVGGFDQRYFLYFEDADLCRKIQAAGYRTVYFPHASVIHHWERAAYKSWRMNWIMLQSAIKYFNKWSWYWC